MPVALPASFVEDTIDAFNPSDTRARCRDDRRRSVLSHAEHGRDAGDSGRRSREVPDAAARLGDLHCGSLRARVRRTHLRLSVARHRGGRARGRPRQPLCDARLPRAVDGWFRRPRDGARGRARHQGRALGGTPDVGARRRRPRRQVLSLLPREGQAGRLPDRRGRLDVADRPLQGRATGHRGLVQHGPRRLHRCRRPGVHVLRRHLGWAAAALVDRQLCREGHVSRQRSAGAHAEGCAHEGRHAGLR